MDSTYTDQYTAPVAAFMTAARQATNIPLDRDTPSALIDLRLRLMNEELDEVFEAITMRDPAQLAYELADLLYVVFGTAVAFGVPIDEVYAAIASANMSKINEITGEPYEVVDGKVKKGPNYQDPHAAIEEIMKTKMVHL